METLLFFYRRQTRYANGRKRAERRIDDRCNLTFAAAREKDNGVYFRIVRISKWFFVRSFVRNGMVGLEDVDEEEDRRQGANKFY